RDVLLNAREADQLLYNDLPKSLGLAPILADDSSNAQDGATFLAELRQAIAELQRSYEDLINEIVQTTQNAFGVTGSLPLFRERLVERARSLHSVASDPVLKAFLIRVDDDALKDTEWAESIASLLGERPPSTWRDRDRGVFEVAIANLSRLFAHLEPLAFAGSKNGSAASHALRIGVTTREYPERERVIHLNAESSKEADRLERALQIVLDKAGTDGSNDVHLAAIARLADRLMAARHGTMVDGLPRHNKP
ncbi:MAG: hypothetical protein H7Y17_16570, partial [Chlorobia bacterium]|nr:hypothetical protein [Fimbriimonadaceae bacterium]